MCISFDRKLENVKKVESLVGNLEISLTMSEMIAVGKGIILTNSMRKKITSNFLRLSCVSEIFQQNKQNTFTGLYNAGPYLVLFTRLLQLPPLLNAKRVLRTAVREASVKFGPVKLRPIWFLSAKKRGILFIFASLLLFCLFGTFIR